MSYVVLARKLRPSRFEDLIGQETVSQTLRNAILSDRVAHAFLFTGSRGVGKTSAARILSRALNCINPEEGNPCSNCENCEEISNNASPDVYEIDAASNRGIDNIRDLRDNVLYAPARCHFKVYIIDEAHMLTLESFNALLKTLEEPPEHVKFVLATTEPHKIPQTIISRCQRYDFVRIPLLEMVDFLEKVISEEQLSMSRRALEMIARQAVGGMRDALTMIDQVLSFTGGSASDEEVMQILGLVDSESRFAFLEALIRKQAEEAMNHFQALQDHGHDLHDLLAELIREVKNLSLIQSVGSDSALFQEYTRDDLEGYTRLSSETSSTQLQQMFEILLELEGRMKRSTHARVCFEMALLQIVSIEPLLGIPEMLHEIRRLRNTPEGQKPAETEKLEQSDPQVPSPQNSVLSESRAQTLPDSTFQRTPFSEDSGAWMTSILRPAVDDSDYETDASEEPEPPIAASTAPPGEWLQFGDWVQKHSPILGGLIRNSVPAAWDHGKLSLGFKSGQPSRLLSEENKQTLEALASEQASRKIRVEWIPDPVVSEVRTIIEQERHLEEENLEIKRVEAKKHPLVEEILKVFSGSMIQEIRLNKV